LSIGRLAAAQATATILDLQPFKSTTTIVVGAAASATLIDLNPRVNSWFVLQLTLGESGGSTAFHLENAAPLHQTLSLDADWPQGLVVRVDGVDYRCELWNERRAAPLARARVTGASYAPLCDGRLYLRNPSAGYRTAVELVTEFLRDHVWGGERIIDAVKSVEGDALLERAPSHAAADGAALPVGPRPALLEEPREGPVPEGLGIALEPTRAALSFGRWYRAAAARGVYVSVIEPGLAAASVLADHRERVRALDAVEAEALVYLAAFDVERYTVGYEVGTEHPRVGWSERSLPQVRDFGMPGPDGFDTIAPLVGAGMVSPVRMPRTVATFTGGFKREHGAFRYGELAHRNHGSHYGFMSHGVLFSSLVPDLATIVVGVDGSIDMKTWRAGNDEELAGIEHARQNGVPLIEPDLDTGVPAPGALVGQWGAGNWSGSASGAQRSVRSGACLQENDGRRYLLYGYFSSATPSAMARVFAAYGCRYAMLLDMNALEHTYLALYGTDDSGITVQHLVRGMEEVDRTVDGRVLPRFMGYPDNRDFFYVFTRQEDPP
jgi:hypothetical protein